MSSTISVIVLSFNDPRILNAIESVRRFDDVDSTRLVVVDGASKTDLVDQIRAALGPNDTLISEPDRGIFDALNKGLASADGDVIGWLGSDDIFSENVKASEVIDALATHDIFVGATAMMDGRRISRVTRAWPSGHGLVRYGLHNPHFSTFGRAAIFKEERFDISHPVADIGYFLAVFDKRPRVKTDERLTTLMQLGGFSTGSLSQKLALNAKLYSVYRRFMNPVVALLAVVLKLGSKTPSVLYFRLNRAVLEDPLLSETG